MEKLNSLRPSAFSVFRFLCVLLISVIHAAPGFSEDKFSYFPLEVSFPFLVAGKSADITLSSGSTPLAGLNVIYWTALTKDLSDPLSLNPIDFPRNYSGPYIAKTSLELSPAASVFVESMGDPGNYTLIAAMVDENSVYLTPQPVSYEIFEESGSSQESIIPPPHQHAPPSIFVYDNPPKVEVLNPDGSITTHTKNPDCGGAPIGNPLAQAIKLATPGTTIELRSDTSGAGLSMYSPCGSGAYWGTSGSLQVIKDITIVSSPGTKRRLSAFSVSGDITKSGGGGIDNVYFEDVIITNKAQDGSCTGAPLIINMGSLVGRLGLYDVRFETGLGCESGYYGKGKKWNLRAQGRSLADYRNIVCTTALEHCLYMDSLGWNGSGDSYFQNIVMENPTGRTGIQLVNRANEDSSPGKLYGGKGNLYFENLVLQTDGSFPESGGSAFTLVGHLGDVFVRNMLYLGGAKPLGALAVWTDTGKGAYTFTDSTGTYSHKRVVLENVMSDAAGADRDQYKISGTKSVEIRGDFDIVSPKTAFSLSHPSDGPYTNGEVCFYQSNPLSAYTGWNGTSKKISEGGVLQTDLQVNAYSCEE